MPRRSFTSGVGSVELLRRRTAALYLSLCTNSAPAGTPLSRLRPAPLRPVSLCSPLLQLLVLIPWGCFEPCAQGCASGKVGSKVYGVGGEAVGEMKLVDKVLGVPMVVRRSAFLALGALTKLNSRLP